MGFEDDIEKGLTNSRSSSPKKMTLETAVEMGEYEPSYLSTFPEWHRLTKYLQFQYIRRGIENRRRHLRVQWAEINNVLNFSLKPHLGKALKNIEVQLKELDEDEERLYLEYSK